LEACFKAKGRGGGKSIRRQGLILGLRIILIKSIIYLKKSTARK